MEAIIIPKNEFASLLRDSDRLRRLEYGGIDNWEWYGDALCQYLQEDEMNKTQDDDYDFRDMAENYMKFWIEE